MDEPSQPPRVGYKRALERHPELAVAVKDFERWLQAVEKWLVWIEDHIPDDIHVSKAEALESLSITPLGLELLERLNFDIYPEGREEITRTEYDVKKLLRAVVALPTISRLKGRKLVRKGQTINTTFKEFIDDTLNGRADLDSISSWEKPKPPVRSANEAPQTAPPAVAVDRAGESSSVPV